MYPLAVVYTSVPRVGLRSERQIQSAELAVIEEPNLISDLISIVLLCFHYSTWLLQINKNLLNAHNFNG